MPRPTLLLAVALVALAVSLRASVDAAEWRPTGRGAPAHRRTRVLFAVAHADGALDTLQAKCQAVSDPASPAYGQHITLDGIRDLVASDANVATVVEWLSDAGIDDITVNKGGDVVDVRATVAQIEALMGPSAPGFRMHQWVHADDATTSILRGAPTHALTRGADYLTDAGLDRAGVTPATELLPRHVAEAVDVVLGLTDLPMLRNMRSRRRVRKVQSSQSTALAAGVAAVLAADPPMDLTAPNLLEVLTNSTTANLIFMQGCGDGTFGSSPIPCSKSLLSLQATGPVKGYTVNLFEEGSDKPISIDIDVGDIHMMPPSPEIPPSIALYRTDVAGLTKYKKTRFEIMAKFVSGNQSSWAGLEYTNTTLADQALLPSPGIAINELRSFYGYDKVDTSAAVPGNSQSVAEFDGQYYSPDDLITYFSRFDVDTDAKVTLVGPNNASSPGGEAQLDIQLIMGAAPNVPTTFWSVAPPPNPPSDDDSGSPAPAAAAPALRGGAGVTLHAEHARGPNDQLYGFILEWALQMNNDTDAPLVTSISYGGSENMFVQQMGGEAYLERCNAEFLKLCTRGRSIVVATGDAGSTNNGHGAASCAVQANFPSDSPWISSVSASQVSTAGAARPGVTIPSLQGAGEIVVSVPEGRQWTTGGGLANISTNARPWYQDKYVEAYLASSAEMPLKGMFNASGRGYSDVSAIGHNHLIIGDGETSYGDGTSASAPVFAAALSLLNNARLAAGKTPVGFFNPGLYALYAQDASAFYDIQVGENRCGQLTCCPYGWGTGPSWDAVSGLGSIGDFQKFIDFFTALP